MAMIRWLATLTLLGIVGCHQSPTVSRVRVWSMWTGDEGRIFRNVLAEYALTQPGLTFENVSTYGADDKTIRAIIGGAPPDLCTVAEPSMVGQLAASGAAMPLDELFAQAGLQRSAITSGALGQCVYQGKLYALPYLVDCYGLLWNQSAFAEVGLDPQTPPRTLEELQQFAVRLTRRDQAGELRRLGCQFTAERYGLLVSIFGGRLYDGAGDRITADDPRNVAALTWWKALMDEQGGLPRVNRFAEGFGQSQSPNNPFFAGKIAMLVSGQWNPFWAFTYAPKLHYGAGAVPGLTATGQPHAWLGGNFFLIPTGSRHVKPAWEFMVWMQSDRAQHRFADTMHGVPHTFTALRDQALRAPTESWRPPFGRFMDIAGSSNAAHFPVLPIAGFYDKQMQNAFEAVGNGKKSPANALRDVQQRVSAEYAKWQR